MASLKALFKRMKDICCYKTYKEKNTEEEKDLVASDELDPLLNGSPMVSRKVRKTNKQNIERNTIQLHEVRMDRALDGYIDAVPIDFSLTPRNVYSDHDKTQLIHDAKNTHFANGNESRRSSQCVLSKESSMEGIMEQKLPVKQCLWTSSSDSENQNGWWKKLENTRTPMDDRPPLLN